MTRYFFIAGLLTITCCTIMSCGGGNDRSVQQVRQSSETSKQVADSSVHQDTRSLKEEVASDMLNEVMELKDIRLNGVLPRYFSLKQFRKTLGEPDSTKLLLDEEPCTSIFEEPDGSVDAKAKHLFKNGSRFECSKQKVAIDEVNFAYGDHLMFKGYRLDGSTTIADLKKIFPNACKHIGTMDVQNDGQLQVITLREDSNNVSDGHINMLIRDGKLYKLHWWFPC